MKRSIAASSVTILFVAALAGCATQEQSQPTVFVPVVAKKAELPSRPRLAIANLSEKSTPAIVLKAYAESILQCQGYAAQLEDILQK